MAQDAARDRIRQDVVESFLGIRTYGAVRASPDGRMLAVEVMRSRKTPFRPGDHPEARSDLWLISLASGEKRQLISGLEDGSAAWSPIWSPDSRRLAYLTNARDGLPRAAWIDLQSGERGLLSERGIDVEVNFGSRSPFWGDARIWGAWTSNDAFLAAALPKGQINPLFRGGAPELVFPPLWARTRAGKLSVTVWDSETNPACNKDTRLVTMGIGGAAQERELITGSIRAVTLSPDHRTAAAVLATAALPPPAVGKFDGEFNLYNLDPRVRSRLSLIPLGQASTGQQASDSSGFRFQSIEDAPRWSRDSRSLYAPRFDVTDNGAGNFCVEAIAGPDGKAPRWPIDCSRILSRRHAQLLALSLGAAPPVSARDLDARIAATAASADLSSDPLGADVSIFSLGRDLVGLANSHTVRLVDLKDGRTLDRKDLSGASVQVSATPASDINLAVLQTEMGPRVLRAERRRLALTDPALPGSDFAAARILPSNRIVWIEHGAKREALWITNDRGGEGRELMALERPVDAEVAGLQRKTFHYRLPDGKDAVAALLLPPDYDPSRSYPMIIDAYPLRDYDEASAARAFDQAGFANVDDFAFASLGYVVAKPSLPAFKGDFTAYEPLAYHSNLIESFASEAIKAGLAAEGRIGLWGLSNGGYLGLGLAASTRRIDAIVSYSPFPDLLMSSERPALIFTADDCAPARFYGNQINYPEDPNGPFWRMGAPSFAAFDRYIRNSPIYHLGPKSPSILMVEGEFDSKGTSDVERVFTRLHRQGVPVQLARYWGEGHNFESPDNIRDRIAREVAWFDRHLAPAASPPAK